MRRNELPVDVAIRQNRCLFQGSGIRMYSTARWLVGLVVAVALQAIRRVGSEPGSGARPARHGCVALRARIAGRRRHHARRRQRDRRGGCNGIRVGGDVSGRRQSRRRRVHGDSSRRRPRGDERSSRARAERLRSATCISMRPATSCRVCLRRSHLAAGVPGSVAGMLDVLEKYGTLPRKAIIAPAIRLAKRRLRVERRSRANSSAKRRRAVRANTLAARACS